MKTKSILFMFSFVLLGILTFAPINKASAFVVTFGLGQNNVPVNCFNAGYPCNNGWGTNFNNCNYGCVNSGFNTGYFYAPQQPSCFSCNTLWGNTGWNTPYYVPAVSNTFAWNNNNTYGYGAGSNYGYDNYGYSNNNYGGANRSGSTTTYDWAWNNSGSTNSGSQGNTTYDWAW